MAFAHQCANGQRVATRVDGTLYYVHQDHLGSTVAVSDAAGGEVGRVQYDPYGEVLTSTLPVTLTDRLFTGQRFDSSTGLYYYNARYYDPHLGRFIQPDSLVPDPLNPQAWNRFSYVYNNPASYVDPSGHDGILVPLLVFGGAFLIGAGVGGYYAYQQGYGFESWQLYAYAAMGGLAGVVGAATGMWIEAALLPVGATAGQALLAGAAGGFAAGVVEQSILEAGGYAILGTEVSAERILLAGVTGGVMGGAAGMARRWLRLRAVRKAAEAAAREAQQLGGQELIDDILKKELAAFRMTYPPEYVEYGLNVDGMATKPLGRYPGRTRISRLAIEAGRMNTAETILHEELHHRFWAFGIEKGHHLLMKPIIWFWRFLWFG